MIPKERSVSRDVKTAIVIAIPYLIEVIDVIVKQVKARRSNSKSEKPPEP